MTERDIFIAALQKPSGPERAAYVAEACAEQPQLRSQVEGLLRLHENAESFLESPAPALVATVDASTIEQPGAIIGSYKLLEQIGEGGFGVVFMAEQTKPVRRKVALKVIKPGMDTRQVIARFEAERQALALMEHPNIARVLDAGTTGNPKSEARNPKQIEKPKSEIQNQPEGVLDIAASDLDIVSDFGFRASDLPQGRPYFVMELVRGTSMTDYCDQHNLPVRERLELFIDVCQAVQHAHQKGIIHRDIKPSNVLVTLHDGKPVVKVIDFGIAKAMGQQLTEKTLFTNFAQMIGTPLYMSPEQAEMSGLDADTRSDIYSLGVLLYELLTGTTPFDKERLKTASFDEIRRIIREEEPPKPSTRMSTVGQAASTASEKRQSDPRKLSRLFRGELDWIVMKALEKDRNRRYETASGLALDIERYLHDEPVQAFPPSKWYRFRKFVRRNKGPVLAVAVVLLALVGGMVGTIWGLVLAERAAAAEKAANELTQKRLTQIEKGNEIVTGIFADLDIQEVKMGADPLEAVLAERLVKAAEQLEGDSAGEPLAVAAIQEQLGVSLMSLGFPDRAIPVLQKSRQTRQEMLAPDHPDTLSSMANLALGYEDAGKLDLAMPLFEETLKLRMATLGPDHPDTFRSMNGLAEGYQLTGKLDLAVPLFEETLKLRKAKLGPDHPSTLSSMNNLAIAYETSGNFDLSLPLKEETLRLKKAKSGPDHPATLISMNNLAEGYRAAGKLDLALPLFDETLKLMKAKLGPYHPNTLKSMNNLGFVYYEAGKLDLAVPLIEEAHRLMKAKLGPDHPNTLNSLDNLANCYRDAGKLDLALPLFEETLELRKAKLGPDHPDTFISMNNLGSCYWSMRQLDKSVPLFEDVLKRSDTKLGRQHPETLNSVANLGVNYLDAGRLTEALPLLEEAYRAGKKYPNLRAVGGKLLDGYAQAGKTDEAAALAKELIADARRSLPPDSPQLAGWLAQVGLSLLTIKAFADAEPVLREGLTIREKKEPDAWTTFNTQSLLGGALLGQKKHADAEPLLLAGYEEMKKREKAIPPQGQVRLAEAADRLVELYTATDKPDELKRWQMERAKYPEAKLSPPPEKK